MSLSCRWEPEPSNPSAPAGPPDAALVLTVHTRRRTIRFRFGRPCLALRP